MRQVAKLYLASFLKNQTYFTPILILFLQFHHLTFQQIFWVFTVGSVAGFLLEIPTGVFADLFGKKKSIIISKFFIFISFAAFGFSSTFWSFVMAQILYEVGVSFRSGTETAYAFDYLMQNKKNPKYTQVKGKQKFWARVSEAIATALGGFFAVLLGYNAVFLIAAIPAFINFLFALTWEDIKEQKEKLTLEQSIKHTKGSFASIVKSKYLIILIFNITLFTAVLAAVAKFIQPYMTQAGIPVEWFGIIYTISLILTAIASAYAYKVEKIYGKVRTINVLTFFAVIPALMIALPNITGNRFVSIYGVILFFMLVIIENIRSPITNNEFHSLVKSEERATQGSILEMFRSLGKIIILPLAGFFADAFSIYVAMLIMAVILLLNSIIFYVRKAKFRQARSH